MDQTNNTPAADPLAALQQSLTAAAAHPFVPQPVRAALPLLLAALQEQQRQIDELRGGLLEAFGAEPCTDCGAQQGAGLTDGEG